MLRDRRWTRPPVFTASARKPSSFNSYAQAAPSGNFSARLQEHGLNSILFTSCAVVFF
jgi:hypothetical protein